MKTEDEIRESIKIEIKNKDQLIAELNACLGRIQALQSVLTPTTTESTDAPRA